MVAQRWPIFYEPLHTTFEARKCVDDRRVQRFYREQRNQADHRANLEWKRLALLGMQHVIVEAVLCVLQRDAFAAEVVDGFTDINEMFKELARYIFIR